MDFSINPGQTKKLTIVFEDDAGQQVPLSAVPTCAEPASPTPVGVGITPEGTPTAADPQFIWDIAAPATLAIGSQFSLEVVGLNADGTKDDKTYVVTVVQPDATQQVATFT